MMIEGIKAALDFEHDPRRFRLVSFMTDGRISVRGKVGDRSCRIKIAPGANDRMGRHEGIVYVWARKKIEQLASRATWDNDSDLPGEIKQVALEYGLMSAYTAFVAVDSSRRTEGDHGITVVVPVPVPDGVRYETTVRN